MKVNRQDSQTISEQAAQWLCVLSEGGAAERSAFMTWLTKSPQHVEEFLLVTATWRKVRQVGASGPMTIEDIVTEALGSRTATNVVTLRESLQVLVEPASARRGLVKWRWAAGFAALALAISLTSWFTGNASTYATAVGEQRTVRLVDGSVLYLNTGSRARVRFSAAAREVDLLGGEALFVVARDPGRPFRVSTQDAVIQAVGTQFNVRRLTHDTQVAVIEGQVKIAHTTAEHNPPSNPSSTQGANGDESLAAGEEATVTGGGRIVKHKVADIAQASAWRTHRLVFRAERLEDVVSQINRYSTRHFRVEGEKARDTLLTATFDADHPESLAAFLKEYSDLSLQAEGDDFVVRGR